MPFSAWLPAAIAAPTPVRALVHSSTLVTAGVYLLIRFSALIEDRGLRKILLIISIITIIMAGSGAIFERDIKKVVALSTLSQLGVIIIILSIGIKELAFFHLITHAMFKSTLFICAGFIIHSVGGSQDRRVIRGFRLRRPVLGVVLRSTNLALCGFPFLAGFYSKDSSLEFVFIRRMNRFISVLVVMGLV
jgi:NADH-ubiquinone oxidoreductase chain 5